MNSLVLTILAVYHLLGINGPYQNRLEQALSPVNSTHHVAAISSLPTIPIKTGREEQPALSAQAIYAVDVASGQPIIASRESEERPIASLTKITTALVLLQKHQADEIITVPAVGPYNPDDAQLRLHNGEQFKFKDLLAAALIPSDNDAAEALAIADSGTIPAFSAKMNRLTQGWGISGAHYVSASGLTDTGNYATAQALANLAKLGLANQMFAKLTSTRSEQISDLSGQLYSLSTTNELLGSRTTGIKTGYTEAAGQCFVGLTTIQGHKVITVVLGSGDRFGETAKLIDYIDRNYKWQ